MNTVITETTKEPENVQKKLNYDPLSQTKGSATQTLINHLQIEIAKLTQNITQTILKYIPNILNEEQDPKTHF